MRIIGITLAATNVDKMVLFYEKVFDLKFKAEQTFGTTLYRSDFNGFSILICPNSIANVDAKKNRIQFDIEVDNFKSILEKVGDFGGEILDEPSTQNNSLFASILDPDGNSIVLKESRTN